MRDLLPAGLRAGPVHLLRHHLQDGPEDHHRPVHADPVRAGAVPVHDCVCVPHMVPVQCTRTVRVCVPVTETVMCCRMVPKCVEKEVPTTSCCGARPRAAATAGCATTCCNSGKGRDVLTRTAATVSAAVAAAAATDRPPGVGLVRRTGRRGSPRRPVSFFAAGAGTIVPSRLRMGRILDPWDVCDSLPFLLALAGWDTGCRGRRGRDRPSPTTTASSFASPRIDC